MPENDAFEFEVDQDLANLEGFGLFGNMAPSTDDEEAPWNGEDLLFPGAAPRNQYEPLDPANMPQIEGMKQDTPEYAARPAAERIEELFSYMRPHRLSLLNMLSAASSPASGEHMDEVAEEFRKKKFSVYTSANLCTMLEAAGALQRVVEDGTPYEQFTPAPEVVVVDGEEYYKPIQAPAVHWLTTKEGQAVLDANNPIERMEEVFRREEDMLSIYKQVLLIAKDGAGMADFSKKVDSNPLISSPRRFFVQHFVESLERCEAIGWDGEKWAITQTGQQVLDEMLDGVEAAREFDPADRASTSDGGTVPTETQGVNW